MLQKLLLDDAVLFLAQYVDELAVAPGAQIGVGAQQTALEHVCAAAQLGQAQHPLLQILVVGLFQSVHEAVGELLHPGTVQLGLFVQVLADLLLELGQLVQTVGQLEGAADGTERCP